MWHETQSYPELISVLIIQMLHSQDCLRPSSGIITGLKVEVIWKKYDRNLNPFVVLSL